MALLLARTRSALSALSGTLRQRVPAAGVGRSLASRGREAQEGSFPEPSEQNRDTHRRGPTENELRAKDTIRQLISNEIGECACRTGREAESSRQNMRFDDAITL
jgi:hypothetical protein